MREPASCTQKCLQAGEWIRMVWKMEAIPIAICDDEILLLPQLTAVIRDSFNKAGNPVAAESFSTAASLLREIYAGKRYSVYFLDIDIPEQDGISLGEQIMEVQPDAILCFVSAREDMILDTFRVRPLAFVRKSRFSEDMDKALRVILGQIRKPEEKETLITDDLGHVHTLFLGRVIYVEAKDKYQNIVSVDGSDLLRIAIRQLEEALVPHHFVRIHRSYLVNLRYVYRIDASEIILDSRVTLPLSRHRRREIQEAFLAYTRKSRKGGEG